MDSIKWGPIMKSRPYTVFLKTDSRSLIRRKSECFTKLANAIGGKEKVENL